MDNQYIDDYNVETSFQISNMSSTYNTENMTALPLTFLYTQGSYEFWEKPNSLIVSSNQIFQLLNACFNP